MSHRALCFAFGGYADLDLTFGEFFHSDHTVMTRFMPQFPYAGAGAMLAENGTGTWLVGQGDYRWGSGDFKLTGPSALFVQVGNVRVTYDVPGFQNQVGGPVGYRGVWQHLALVRQGQTLRLFLNGKHLTGIESADLTLPSSGLPADGTPLRIARRTGGSGESNLFWQFFGLIDDVAVYTRALTGHEIQQAMNAALTGSETGLLAAYTFDTGSQPQKLSRPVYLPTASDIAEHVNPHAAHPVPVYYVGVSAHRDSSQDRKKLDIRPSKVQVTLPFTCGEWWHVTQGREDPGGSHNGGTAGFCSDFVRVNGVTFDSKIFAGAAGRVIEVDPHDAAMCVYHTSFERAVYMHLKDGCFAECFPGYPGNPVDKPPAQQPSFAFRQHVADVGHNPDEGDHLHFVTSAISGDTFATAGPSLPNAITDYYVSADQGKTWKKVDLGIPQQGDLVARYPWSPWGDRGDPFAVAPAIASRAPGLLDIFVRGENDRLWHMTWDGHAWSDWEDLGGRLTSSPAAVSRGPDRLDVFVRGHDGQLAHRKWEAITGWSDWRSLGGRLTSAPAVASWAPDRLDVFVSGHDNQLAQIRWNGDSWSDWRDLGGRLTSAPAAVSWAKNRIDVLVRGHEGQLAQKRWTDDKGWSDWRNLGGRLTSGPAVASWGPNRLDVFVRGHDGQLAQMRWNGEDWSEWRDLGGRLTSGPGAVSWGPDRIDVFVRGHEHQLAQKRWAGDDGWSDWRNLDGA